jgi:hypothetical protein
MGKHAPARCSARLGRAGWQSKDSHNIHGNAPHRDVCRGARSMTMPTEDRLLTIDEAAEILNLSKDWLY